MLTPLITFVLSAVLLYIPPVQRWAIDQATTYASDEFGMDIRMDRVRVSFPLDLELQGLQVIHQGEALGSMGSMVVDLDLMRILLLQIRIEGIELKDLDVETGNLIECTHQRKLKAHLSESRANQSVRCQRITGTSQHRRRRLDHLLGGHHCR